MLSHARPPHSLFCLLVCSLFLLLGFHTVYHVIPGGLGCSTQLPKAVNLKLPVFLPPPPLSECWGCAWYHHHTQFVGSWWSYSLGLIMSQHLPQTALYPHPQEQLWLQAVGADIPVCGNLAPKVSCPLAALCSANPEERRKPRCCHLLWSPGKQSRAGKSLRSTGLSLDNSGSPAAMLSLDFSLPCIKGAGICCVDILKEG